MTKHFNDEYDAVVEIDANAGAVSRLLEENRRLRSLIDDMPNKHIIAALQDEVQGLRNERETLLARIEDLEIELTDIEDELSTYEDDESRHV